MIFYASALSSYSAKVRIALEYKGLAYQEVPPPGGYQSETYRQVVPTGRIPALGCDGAIISESEVILEYLEERYPDPPMLPAGLIQRANARFYARFHDLYFEPLVRKLFPHIRLNQRDPQVLDQTKNSLLNLFEEMSAWPVDGFQFAQGKVALSDCGFLVNIPLAVQLLQACDASFSIPDRWTKWWKTGHQIPAVATALSPWKIATEKWIFSQNT